MSPADLRIIDPSTGSERSVGRSTLTSTMVTIIGAKGGVGKTTVAANLAAAIALDTDRSVLLVDLDSRFGDLAVALDINPEFSLVDVASVVDHNLTEQGFLEALTPHSSGMRILAAPQHPAEWNRVSCDQLRAVLAWARHLFDFIVLDSPGAFTELVATAIDEADRVLMLSSLERTSLKDTQCTLQVFAEEPAVVAKLDLILNQVHAKVVLTPAEVEATLGLTAAHRIDYDERIVHANAVGEPVVIASPRARASRQLRELAALIAPDWAAAFAEASMQRSSFPGRLAFWRTRAAA